MPILPNSTPAFPAIALRNAGAAASGRDKPVGRPVHGRRGAGLARPGADPLARGAAVPT